MIERRKLLGFAAGATLIWPRAAPAQQLELPVVGFLNGQSPETFGHLVAAFHDGLGEAGYVESRNVAVEYRWAQGQYDRLPALAAELVRRDVAVIFAAGGPPSVFAAKSATDTIPVVAITPDDPVAAGLAASLSRPGGNLTGVAMFSSVLEQKRLALLHELVPSAATIAVLSPAPQIYQDLLRDVREAAATLGLELLSLTASSEPEIDAAFAELARGGAQALLIGSDPYLFTRREQVVSLAARYRIPTVYTQREYVAVGGLMSYATSLSEAYRQSGLQVGRVLDGQRPGDLPIVRPTTFELALNLRTAAALGIAVPPSILIQATEVIE